MLDGVTGPRDGAGGRGEVENALDLILAGAPFGWSAVRVEFVPASRIVQAVATAGGTASCPLSVPEQAVSALFNHHYAAQQSGSPYQSMTIDCAADGRLMVRTEPATAPTDRNPSRRACFARAGLAVITAVCLVTAAIVVALTWRWSSPPEADRIAVAPPAPRQDEAWALIDRWYDAEAHSDAPQLRALACAEPSERIDRWITAIERQGNRQQIVFPEGIIDFDDLGSQFTAEVGVRIRPLDEPSRQAVKAQQKHGGLFTEKFTIVDQNGLKICDSDLNLHHT